MTTAAIDLVLAQMRRGEVLTLGFESGQHVYRLLPCGRKVTERIALRVINRVDVEPRGDGLFADISQTYVAK